MEAFHFIVNICYLIYFLIQNVKAIKQQLVFPIRRTYYASYTRTCVKKRHLHRPVKSFLKMHFKKWFLCSLSVNCTSTVYCLRTSRRVHQTVNPPAFQSRSIPMKWNLTYVPLQNGSWQGPRAGNGLAVSAYSLKNLFYVTLKANRCTDLMSCSEKDVAR